MKTVEEIITGIEHRIFKIEQFMDKFAPGTKNYDIVKNHVWEQHAIHVELCTLLEWIKEE